MSYYSDPVTFKILGGTLRSTQNLCETCRNAHRMRGSHTNREVVRCDANYSNPRILREPIGECTRYNDARLPSLDMMQEIAWSIMTDKGGKKMGFLSPEELRRRGEKPPPIGF